MPFTVRRLELRDKARWLALFEAYNAFYNTAIPDDVVALTWGQLISGAPDCHVGLVAEDDAGTVVGLAHVLFHRSTWSPTTCCYLEDLFVDPAMRAKGAGRCLIAAVYAEADARQCTRTYWLTEESNDRARGLYDQMAAKTNFVQYRR